MLKPTLAIALLVTLVAPVRAQDAIDVDQQERHPHKASLPALLTGIFIDDLRRTLVWRELAAQRTQESRVGNRCRGGLAGVSGQYGRRRRDLFESTLGNLCR